MEPLDLRRVEIRYKNFAGRETEYNALGSRVFSVVVDDLDLAADLISDGWAFKPLLNEDDDVWGYYMQVKINYDSNRPPRIYTVSPLTGKQVQLGPETVECLDSLTIDYADIVVNPYEWEVRGDSGVKAYCKIMYALIEEHPFDIEWANFSTDKLDVGLRSGVGNGAVGSSKKGVTKP